MSVYYEQNIKGEAFEKLLYFLKSKADLVAFVTRKDIGINQYRKQILELFSPYLIDEEQTNSWFLNEVVNYKLIGHVYYYEYNSEII